MTAVLASFLVPLKVGSLRVLATEPANQWGYVAFAYVVVVGALVGYAALTILRGRRVGRQLPPEDRRWM
jgi:hypothetical protein